MTETNQLDAHDALLAMAEAFDGADERGKAFVEGFRTPYLCNATDHLQTKGRLADGVRQSIRDAINDALVAAKKEVSLFPHTRDGARQRAAWCRAEAAKLRPVVADVVPETRVRCWTWGNADVRASVDDGRTGLWCGTAIRYVRDGTCFHPPLPNEEVSEITPAAALDLLRDWPEGRERFLAYCREHPPEAQATIEAPKVTEPATKVMTNIELLRTAKPGDEFIRGDGARLKVVEVPKFGDNGYPSAPYGAIEKDGRDVGWNAAFQWDAPTDAPQSGLTPVAKSPARTVADVLREMPVGTRFTRPFYMPRCVPWEKTGDDVFADSFVTIPVKDFGYQDRPADDPERGIILLPAAEPVEQPAGVARGGGQRAHSLPGPLVRTHQVHG